MLYDVVILGGGVVGATLALMLAQNQYQVLLIEKNPPQSLADDLSARTVALSYASIHILESLQVWQPLQHRAVPIKEVAVSVAGRFGRSHLRALQQGVAFLGQVVTFAELEQVLFTALAHSPTVTILRPATLDYYQPGEHAWDITITHNETVLPIKTRLLVAADGIHSMLRSALAIPVNKTDYGHFAVMANMVCENAPLHSAIERFLPDGAIALLPWQNSIATCVFTVTKDKQQILLQMQDAEYLRTCQEALGSRHGKLVKLGKRVCLPLTMQVAQQQIGNRFLLMGNAAHSLHPIAAQGLNLSLRDIWQLKKQLTRLAARVDLGCAQFLANYQAARDSDQSRIIFATDKIAKYLSGGPLPMELRALGVTLFDSFWPAKKLFARYSMGLM